MDISSHKKPPNLERTKANLKSKPSLALWFNVICEINNILDVIGNCLEKVEFQRSEFHPVIENLWNIPWNLQFEDGIFIYISYLHRK